MRSTLVLGTFLLVIAAGVAATGCTSGDINTTTQGSSASSGTTPATQRAGSSETNQTSLSIPTAGSSSTTASTISSTTTTTQRQPKAPYTLLVLGTDWRPPLDPPGNSDVIMLLRVDPEQGFLSILQVTRDLWVEIPGYGKNKINQAYLHGEAPLSIAALEKTFGLDIDHHLVLGFQSFQTLIGLVSGVYVDVDRAYHPFDSDSYTIPAGYRLTDPATALIYSRMRHDSNSVFGRMARELWLLFGIREQIKRTGLLTELPAMVDRAMASIDTDMSAGDITDLLTWAVNLDATRIRPAVVKGPGKMIGGQSAIVLSEKELHALASDFLVAPQSLDLPDAASVKAPSGDPLSSGAWKALQAKVPFALEAPTFVPTGFARHSTVPAKGGTYNIASNAGPTPAVRVLYRYKSSDDYLGLTATSWTEAPVAGKGQEFQANGTVYTIVGPADKVSHIWWVRNGVLYFLSNTVMWTVRGDDMLKMALSMVPVGPQ